MSALLLSLPTPRTCRLFPRFPIMMQFSTLSTAVSSQYKERNAQLEAALRATVEEIEYRIPAVTLDGIQSDITAQVNVSRDSLSPPIEFGAHDSGPFIGHGNASQRIGEPNPSKCEFGRNRTHRIRRMAV